MLTSFSLDVTGRTDTMRLDKLCSFGVCPLFVSLFKGRFYEAA